MLLKTTKSTNIYTEGVISLLEKHVPPIKPFPAQRSCVGKGGPRVISTFLISERHLRCCVLPNIHRRCHQLNRKVYAIYKPLPRTAKLCGEGWSSCYIHISIKRKTLSVLFSCNPLLEQIRS